MPRRHRRRDEADGVPDDGRTFKNKDLRRGARLLNALSTNGGYELVSADDGGTWVNENKESSRITGGSLSRGSSVSKNESELGSSVDGRENELVCCLHGRKCVKGVKKAGKSRKSVDRHELSNQSQSRADAASPGSAYSTDESLFRKMNINESNMDSFMSRRRAVIEAGPHSFFSVDRPTYGYEKVCNGIAREPPSMPNEREKHFMHEELYVEPGVNNNEDDRLTLNGFRSQYGTSSSSGSSLASFHGYEPISQHIVARKPVYEQMKVAAPYDPALYRLYMGEKTAREAEVCTRQRVSFRLYHRLPDQRIESYDDLIVCFPLFIVYHSSKGNYYHFPIVNRRARSTLGTIHEQFTVEYGEPAPFFNSLSSLVKYYETYVTLGKALPDIFPWWLQDGKTSESAGSGRQSR